LLGWGRGRIKGKRIGNTSVETSSIILLVTSRS
jgi:hypothetical protein